MGRVRANRGRTTEAVRVGKATSGIRRAIRKPGGLTGRTVTGARGGMSDQALGANNRGTGGKAASAAGFGVGGVSSGGRPTGSIVEETRAPGGTPVRAPSTPRPTVPSAPAPSVARVAAPTRATAPPTSTRKAAPIAKPAPKPAIKPQPKKKAQVAKRPGLDKGGSPLPRRNRTQHTVAASKARHSTPKRKPPAYTVGRGK